MYTKEQLAIRETFRNELTQFMGAFITNCAYTESAAKENVAAIICEELVKYIQNEKGELDLQASKPVFKSIIWILNKRKQDVLKEKEELNNELLEAVLDEVIVKIDTIKEMLEKYTKSINEI